MSELLARGSAALMRSPELIAAEINSIKSQTRKMVLYNSIEIGRRLVEAKSLLEHGTWLDWLEKAVEYSERTAQNLMRIFEEYGADQLTLLEDNAKTQALADLSYTQAVALLAIPEDEREQFVAEHDIDSMSTRELQQVIKERDQARKEREEALHKLENAKQTAIEKAEEAKRLHEEKQKAESDFRLSDKVLREAQADLKMLQDTLKKERDESKKDAKDFEKKIFDLRKQLESAQKTGTDEEIDQLKESLEEAEKELSTSAMKIAELERQLKEAPIEAVTVEKVPEVVEKELQDLRGNSITIKYRVYFNSLVETFDNLLKALNEMAGASQETHEKFKKATAGLLEKMKERL